MSRNLGLNNSFACHIHASKQIRLSNYENVLELNSNRTRETRQIELESQL